ncbi:protein of unknown function [Xenorhabdus nematophila AN6/1]|nr:protein of unknown function [Xenorhabdus nematophila AN6/1]
MEAVKPPIEVFPRLCYSIKHLMTGDTDVMAHTQTRRINRFHWDAYDLACDADGSYYQDKIASIVG